MAGVGRPPTLMGTNDGIGNDQIGGPRWRW
jgi:hypothetical protein